MKPYYYVFNISRSLPTVKHDTTEKAVSEAERLAAKHPGESFEILKCVAMTRTTTPQTFWNDGEWPTKYRDLTEEDTIQPGDEWQNGSGEWIPRQTNFGVRFNYLSNCPHRRKIQ